MKKEDIQQNDYTSRSLDDFDRRILGELVQDARQTYAVIGKSVGLSAPAVHGRVKRMKSSGVITVFSNPQMSLNRGWWYLKN